MCTVTYLPLANHEFILTSNRDEAPKRAMPVLQRLSTPTGAALLYPQDAGAGGTWLAMHTRGAVLCLLNGAIVKHKHRPPYKLSRGIMVLQALRDYATFPDFFNHYDFEGIEPFTLIAHDQRQLWQTRWDGSQLHITPKAADQAHLWASSTLYPPIVQQKRQLWWQQFLARTPAPDVAAVVAFHKTAGDGDPRNDVVMNRDGIVQTISISSVYRQRDCIALRYEDLQYHSVLHETLPILLG